MQYLYYKNSGSLSIKLRGDEYKYIFKVRRHREGELIALRNLKDNRIYHYKILSISKKEAYLTLQSSKQLLIEAKKKLHIGWCLIDPKNIERVIATLNEIGVTSISFIYCTRSQRNFRVDLKRLNRIILNSSQQSGRSQIMRLEILDNLEAFLKIHPKAKMLNFSKNTLNKTQNIDSIVVGCEGGFTQNEIKLFEDIVGLDTPLILKSESAICAIASKILL